MENENRLYKILPVCAAILLTLGFIFGHSAMSRSASLSESSAVAGWLMKLLRLESVDPDRLVGIVRKLAHFAEFALLGGETSLLLRAIGRPVSFLRGGFSLLCCLLAAVCDETVQIFSGRGPGIVDVWIDFAGAFFGFFLLLGLSGLLRKKARRVLTKQDK